jgi:hypothetical protein
MNRDDNALRKQLVWLLTGGQAHLSFDDAVADVPVKIRGSKPAGATHTPWQLLEHMRLAQWDILEFTRDPKHVSPAFPDGYWPATEAPPDGQAWNQSVKAFRADLAAMVELVEDGSIDLFARIPHAQGQTVLREALLLADHNAYHLGQLVATIKGLSLRK